MKKILVFTAILMFSASSAFAASSLSIDDKFTEKGYTLHGAESSADKDSPSIGKLSSGVDLGILVDATNGNGYSLVTQHSNGTKAFGTSYDSTAIYTTKTDVDAGTVILSVPTATDTTNFVGADWKAM